MAGASVYGGSCNSLGISLRLVKTRCLCRLLSLHAEHSVSCISAFIFAQPSRNAMAHCFLYLPRMGSNATSALQLHFNAGETNVGKPWKNRYQHEGLRFCILLRSCCTIHLCTELVLSTPRKNELCPAQNPIACIEHPELDPLAFGVDCNTTKFRLQVVIAISPRTSRYSHRRKLGWFRLPFCCTFL